MIYITGCRFTENEKDKSIENTAVNQKIVLIYKYENYSETPTYWGFYVNSKGDKIEFDFSETVKEKIGSQNFISDGDMYQFLIETKEINSKEFLSCADVSKCYKLLS